MAICAMSLKAYERTADVPHRGLYFDLRNLWDFIDKKNYQYTSTPSLSHMYALDKQLQHIVHEEGIEARFARHEQCAAFTRAWADEYFRVFPNRNHLSKTLTVIDARPKGCSECISIPQLNRALAERNLQLGNGYGALQDKTFRIAHMGELRMEDMLEITSAVVDVLKR